MGAPYCWPRAWRSQDRRRRARSTHRRTRPPSGSPATPGVPLHLAPLPFSWLTGTRRHSLLVLGTQRLPEDPSEGPCCTAFAALLQDLATAACGCGPSRWIFLTTPALDKL